MHLHGGYLLFLSFHCPGPSWEWVCCLLLLLFSLSKELLWNCPSLRPRKQPGRKFPFCGEF